MVEKPLSEQETPVKRATKQDKITDLLVRYWGLGNDLSSGEKEILLAALDEENKRIGGPTHVRAIARLKERGIH